MPVNCTKCEKQPDIPLWCVECKAVCCQACLQQHKSHNNKVSFICQQCENSQQNQETFFCEDCEQHLCFKCNQKIHNKGKRAKHMRYASSSVTLNIKRIFIICDDVLEYYGFINFQAMFMEILDMSNSNQSQMVIIEKTKGISQYRNKNDLKIQQFNAERQFDEDYCCGLKAHYPSLLTITLIETQKSKKYYEIAKKGIQCKIQLKQLAEPVKRPNIKASQISGSSLSIPNSSFKNKSNISAKYPNHQNRNHLGVNISTSTQNSLRKRKRKSPIIYFHPYIVSKEDSRSQIEDHYRSLASNGTLMIKKKNCQIYDQTILRTFMRNIGQQQVEYVSLIIDSISIECLYWVIRSIEEDMMAPTQKLILSRLKQSFDIKVHSKLWSYVIRYLISRQYQRDRFQLDRIAQIPKLLIKPFNNEDNYILYCKPDDRTPVEWIFQDLGKLDQSALQWKQFLELINNYFAKNTQIGGGRYGCVQFIKFNADNPLRDCSLGKLSMFVQEAINKGIIRYHKTLLVSNKQCSESEQSHSKFQGQDQPQLIQLQKKIKIYTLQLLLFDLFQECGPNTAISLAQIPQNLRKNIHFQINYIQLGYPKLKNLLSTLNQFIDIQLNKSSIAYKLRQETYKLIQERRQQLSKHTDQFLKALIDEMLKIITSCNMKGMVIQQLYSQLSTKIGFFLDYRIFNVPDFINFVSYYGQNYFQVQNNMNYIVVYPKNNTISSTQDKASTPTFRQACGIQSIKDLACLSWQTNLLMQPIHKQEQLEQQNQSQSYSDYKSIYNILDDDNSQSKSYPNTVIVKDGSVKNELNLVKFAPIKQNSDYSDSFQEGIWAVEEESSKNKAKVHNRMYSNTTQQKTQHYRVYSNMSRN